MEVVTSVKDTTTADTILKRSRERAIGSPRGLEKSILATPFSVNV